MEYFVNVSLIKLTYADDEISFNIKNYNFTQYTKEIYVYIHIIICLVLMREREGNKDYRSGVGRGAHLGERRHEAWVGGCAPLSGIA